MLISMTGFGRAVCDARFGRLVVEIQSVNRKYLEVFLSLPKELNRFDIEIRKWVSESISRGQVSIRLFLTPSEEALSQLMPDVALLKRLKKAWIKLAKAGGYSEKSIDLPFLLERLPAVSSQEPEDEQLAALKKCVSEALQSMVEMKRKEGASLAIDIGQRLLGMERMIDQIEKIAPDSVTKQRQKLQERMKEVLAPGAELDERILREVAFFADRIDITEEITRFHSHIGQFQEILQAKNGPVGRKLDFLVQEIGREINTIGSKSADAAISRLVVDAKSELEKIREQIQNVE